jgi:hypothetical protein
VSGTENWAIRSAVACNKNVEMSILLDLAQDFHEDVRSSVAENPSFISELLNEKSFNLTIPKRSETMQLPNKNQPRGSLKILFITSDVYEESRVTGDQEYRDVNMVIKYSGQANIQLISLRAARVQDFTSSIWQEKPNIVHFSGHGSGGIIHIRGNNDRVFELSAGSLSDQLEINKEFVEGIVLSACETDTYLEKMVEHLVFAVGMKGKPSNRVAIDFSIGFYQGLAQGYSPENAFKNGLTQLEAKNQQFPVIIMKDANGEIKRIQK